MKAENLMASMDSTTSMDSTMSMKSMKKKIGTIFLILSLCLVFTGTDLFRFQNVAATQKVPKAPTVSAQGYEKIKISWSTKGQTKVYRSTSKNGTYRRICTTSKSYYYDMNAAQNKTYYYKIKTTAGTSLPKVGKINTVPALSKIPAYSGQPYTVVNNNIPKFRTKDLAKSSFEKYSKLDTLGRAKTAFAMLDKTMMPDAERESIGMIKPSGWHTVRYDDLIEDKYLYHRCHLVGYGLTGQNANTQNLITGTQYMNVEGMLPFENQVNFYMRRTGNHVLYRVTPVYGGKHLVATGVQMEARSVEDGGKGVCFNVFVYNVQPGIAIDYADGSSHRILKDDIEDNNPPEQQTYTYVLNTNSRKFHRAACLSVSAMKDSNKAYGNDREQIISQGYEACKVCKP